jgi:energy-coupling factor transport system substrate-specific component
MFTAGWVGMSAAMLRPITRLLKKSRNQPAMEMFYPEILLLAGFGLVWGFLYGALMNLWQWPFIIGPQDQSWIAGMDLGQALQHYFAFYLVTSLAWDAIAAMGNVLLVLLFGPAALKALRRFQSRFVFRYTTEKIDTGECVRQAGADGHPG